MASQPQQLDLKTDEERKKYVMELVEEMSDETFGSRLVLFCFCFYLMVLYLYCTTISYFSIFFFLGYNIESILSETHTEFLFI